jgi:diguanylate cyclase (GGDEF)-like protein
MLVRVESYAQTMPERSRAIIPSQRTEENPRAYEALSKLPFPKSYPGKMLLVAFLGTHVPLVVLVLYLVRGASSVSLGAKVRILLVALGATLTGTAATLVGLRELLAPVSVASEALRRYLDRGELPDLPTGYQDEAGKLMADVHHVSKRLQESFRQLGEQAAKDPLTSAYNRRVAQERLYEDLARVERGGGAFALALLDLDQFKPLNDRFGHGAGDACLKHFAEVLGRTVREEDWVARWGGDEFLVRLWEADEARSGDRALERVAEELRKSPTRLPNGEAARLTFSAGVTRWGGRGDVDVRGLLERADEALYRAKQEGGDTIVRA